MRNCFVPHCDAFCKKNGILKRMMFSAPKENFGNWKKVLFNKREFRETDRVCERHFDRSQILTHWEHIINNEVHQLEREKPKIKGDAVPYLNLPETDDVILSTPQKRTHKEPKKRKQNPTTLNHNEKVVKKVEVENECCAVADIEIDGGIEIKTSTKSPTKSLRSGRSKMKAEIKLSDEEKHQIFDTVYDDIYEVVLPNTLWGIHRDPEERQYIAFTMFNASQMQCSIAVKITTAFDLNVFVNGVQKSSETLNELSVDVLTKLLSQLNENSDIAK